MEDYSVKNSNKGTRQIFALVAVLLLVVVAVLILVYFTKIHQVQSSTDEAQVQFTIESGESARSIARALDEKSLIGGETVFLIYAYLNNAAGKIQAGEYELSRRMSIVEIVEVITEGRAIPTDRSVTVIEGWSNDQIARNLARQNIYAEVDFQRALARDDYNTKFSALAQKFSYQGFLFPDTYSVGKDDVVLDLIKNMLLNFESKITDKMLADLEARGSNLSKAIILASIVEKEVGRNKETLTDADLEAMQTERELVASVFYNRLEIGMPLESDATVNYVTGKSDRSATIADTKIKSPYNTYQVRGLPPAPIANPGLGSIRAVIYPATSDYLFFLNSPDGTAYFAKSLAEHNANRAKYLR